MAIEGKHRTVPLRQIPGTFAVTLLSDMKAGRNDHYDSSFLLIVDFAAGSDLGYKILRRTNFP
jgi:hypothetical protein